MKAEAIAKWGAINHPYIHQADGSFKGDWDVDIIDAVKAVDTILVLSDGDPMSMFRRNGKTLVLEP